MHSTLLSRIIRSLLSGERERERERVRRRKKRVPLDQNRSFFLVVFFSESPTTVTMSISASTDSQEFTLEIPVWVQNKRKWVTGITKKTTFDDLIYALLAQADLLKTVEINQAITGYAIAECIQSPSGSAGTHENDGEATLATQRIHKGRTKVIKAYKTWQFDKYPLTILQLVSTSTSIENSSSSTKLRSKLFRRFLPSKSSSSLSPSQSDSAILSLSTNHHSHQTEESQHQKLLQHFQENFAILERQKRLLDYLDEKIHQVEQNSTGTSVTLNDVSRLFSPCAPVQQEQLIFATQLCNSILTVQERLEEKSNLLNHVEQAISNELNQVLHQSHYDTLPGLNLLNGNEKQQATATDLTTLKNSIYRSRELSRIQSKEMHDLDLSLREAEILLTAKYDELKHLEQETSTRPSSVHYSVPIHQPINADEQQQQVLPYETLEMALHSMKEIDEDSGINSLTSDDSNQLHHQAKSHTQLETLV